MLTQGSWPNYDEDNDENNNTSRTVEEMISRLSQYIYKNAFK